MKNLSAHKICRHSSAFGGGGRGQVSREEWYLRSLRRNEALSTGSEQSQLDRGLLLFLVHLSQFFNHKKTIPNQLYNLLLLMPGRTKPLDGLGRKH